MNINDIPLTKSLISNTQAARHFGVDKTTLKRWREKGKLTGIWIGGRVYYEPSVIENFIEFGERA